MSNDSFETDAQRVSLLADGQLQGEDFGRAVAHLTHSADARQAWDSYHLVGEVMRHGAPHARAHDAEFVKKLRQKITLESTEIIAVSAIPISAIGKKVTEVRVANDGRWRRVVGLASVALVGVLAWQGYRFAAPTLDQSGAGQLAQRQLPASASAVPGAPQVVQTGAGDAQLMLRDPRLDALLAAHRQFGGSSALQMPSGFLRNATFEEGKR